MALQIPDAGALADATTQPSRFWIEHELERVLPALVDVDEISTSDDGDVATLIFSGSTSVADAIRSVELNSTVIQTMELIDELRREGSRMRVVRLNIR